MMSCVKKENCLDCFGANKYLKSVELALILMKICANLTFYKTFSGKCGRLQNLFFKAGM
jgi:hypothetical protein